MHFFKSDYAYNKPRNSFDMNDKLGGTSFKASYDWENDSMIQAFSKYTAESFGLSFFALWRNALMQ
jgi:hypothetical protein